MVIPGVHVRNSLNHCLFTVISNTLMLNGCHVSYSVV